MSKQGFIPTPIDKVKHILVGLVLAHGVAVLYGISVKDPILHPAVMGLFVTAVVASLKEGWDARGHGTPDRMDYWATVAGGAHGVFIYTIIELLIKKFA